jgi:predicted permease
MLTDLRLALRMFRRAPGFSAIAVLVIALGAGANATVFSVVRAVLIEPLPFAAPDRLVSIWPGTFLSNGDLEFARERTRTLAAIAAVSPGWSVSMTGAGDPVRWTAAKVSANLFDVLGATPLLGRTLHAGEDLPGRTRVIVLSHAAWQSQFAGDQRVIGRTISVEGAPHQVVGVMRPDFELLGRRADVWMPFPFDRSSSQWKMRAAQGIARLADGVDAGAAGTELRSLAPDWRQALGYGTEWGRDAAAEPVRATSIGETRDPLLLLAGAVGLIVLLTATNLGTLLMGRHVGRLRELGMRTALGATRARIIRQALVESGVLAIAGAAAGAIAAWLALPAFIALLPADMPRLAAIAVDVPVLATVVMVSVIAVLVFGVAPTLIADRPGRLTASLRVEIGRASGPGPAARRALHVLVVGQVALATVIGAGALLMARSLSALGNVPPGFDPERVLTLKIQPSGPDARELSRAVEYYRRVMNAVSAVPGVLQVGAINHLPLSGYNWVAPVRAGDQPLAPGSTPPRISWRMIDGPYFTAMTIPIRAGRAFTDLDGPASEQVAIVNDAFAERFFGSPAAAVGRIIQIGFGPTETASTVVGVVGSVRHTSLAEAPAPEFYRPLAQTLPVAVAVVAKTAGRPDGVAPAVRQAVWSVNRDVPIADMQPLASVLASTLGRPRLMAVVLTVFGLVGLAVVICGVYGVTAYFVRLRQKEMGIRLALGAAPADVGRLVLGQGLAYALAGLGIGLPAALAASALIRSLLYGTSPADPLTFVALAAVILAASISATLVPALRARRVNPASVLRQT